MPGWDEVERRVLSACAEPALMLHIQTRTDLSAAAIVAELHGCVGRGLVEQVVEGGVRYRLTTAGRARLTALTAAKAA